MDLENILTIVGFTAVGISAVGNILVVLPSLDLHKERKKSFERNELARMPTFRESVRDYTRFLKGYVFSCGRNNLSNVDLDASYK